MIQKTFLLGMKKTDMLAGEKALPEALKALQQLIKSKQP